MRVDLAMGKYWPRFLRKKKEKIIECAGWPIFDVGNKEYFIWVFVAEILKNETFLDNKNNISWT